MRAKAHLRACNYFRAARSRPVCVRGGISGVCWMILQIMFLRLIPLTLACMDYWDSVKSHTDWMRIESKANRYSTEKGIFAIEFD